MKPGDSIICHKEPNVKDLNFYFRLVIPMLVSKQWPEKGEIYEVEEVIDHEYILIKGLGLNYTRPRMVFRQPNFTVCNIDSIIKQIEA